MPPYHHSFGPLSENAPENTRHSFLPLQRSLSHHSFGDPTPGLQGWFNPTNYIQELVGFNPLGPEDHFSGDHAMEMNEDTDPMEPPTGTPTHPIEVSDGSSFHGSPYRGPDSFQARFNQYEWYFTPTHHSSPHEQQQQQDPSEDSRFVVVTPPPPPPPVQQQPPEPPRRRRTTARMSVRGGVRISTPQPSSGNHYSPLYEDPQVGESSNPVSEVNSSPVAPPPLGFGDPIPAYTGAAAYNPFEQPAHTNFNYANVDPYQATWDYNALHPKGPFGVPYQAGYPRYGYPPYGYQQPPPPQPPPYQQTLVMSPPQHQEILQRINEVRQEVREDRRKIQGMFKGLVNLIKGKSKKDH
ncbi:hypothetical protein Hanom_Chr01g00055571 [Helianthus anomalus]